MKPKAMRRQRWVVCLGFTCLGLLAPSPGSSQEFKERATLKGHTNSVASMTYSPDGKTLASGSWDETIKLWDVQSGKERITLKGHTSFVYAVAFSPDGKTLASASTDGMVKQWDVPTGNERVILQGHKLL